MFVGVVLVGATYAQLAVPLKGLWSDFAGRSGEEIVGTLDPMNVVEHVVGNLARTIVPVAVPNRSINARSSCSGPIGH
jgi:hypothetical protein